MNEQDWNPPKGTEVSFLNDFNHQDIKTRNCYTPISSLYSCCNSNKHLAQRHPSYSSDMYCTSLMLSCTTLHWHLVYEFALHSIALLHLSQGMISCLALCFKVLFICLPVVASLVHGALETNEPMLNELLTTTKV